MAPEDDDDHGGRIGTGPFSAVRGHRFRDERSTSALHVLALVRHLEMEATRL